MSLGLRESSGGACPFSTAQYMQEVKPATTLGSTPELEIVNQ